MSAKQKSGSGVPPLNQQKEQRRDASATLAAPTGQKTIAQGSALGSPSHNQPSPEGAKENEGIPMGWKSAPLGELCERITKGSSPNWQGFEYCESGIIFVRSQNVGWGDLKLDEVAHLPAAFNEKEKKSVLKADDVLLNLVGASIGRACVASPEVDGGNVNQAVAVIRVRSEFLAPKFLVNFLISPSAQARIHSEKVDVARANFSLEDTRSLSIPLPPLPEQRRIVAEIEKQFTRLETGVAALRRVQASLKRYRAAVLKAACEGKLVPNVAAASRHSSKKKQSGSGVPPLEAGKEQSRDGSATFETGAALLARILTERRQNWTVAAASRRRTSGKQSRDGSATGQYKEPAVPDTASLPLLPEGWTWARLEQLGLTFGGLTKNPKRAKLPKQLPYLRVANVYANELRLDEIEYIGVADYELAKLLVRAGDLLVVEGNGSRDQIGRLAIWDGSIDPCVHQNHIIKVRPVEARMPKWILYWLQSPNGRHFVEKVASSTSGLYTLSVNKVGDLPIALPPLAEQTRIVAEVERRLSVVEELEAVVSANLLRAVRLRQSILQKAFTGQLV